MGKPRSKRSLVPLRQEGREETEPTRGIKPLPLTLIGSMQSEAPASRGDGGKTQGRTFVKFKVRSLRSTSLSPSRLEMQSQAPQCGPPYDSPAVTPARGPTMSLPFSLLPSLIT